MIFAILTGLVVTLFERYYVFLLTIIISMILFLLAMNLRSITRGDEGYTIILPGIPLGVSTLTLTHPLARYYVIFFMVAVSFFLVRQIFQAPMGRAIVAIKENEERAKVLGYNTTLLKLISFTMSGTVAGLAGCLYVILNGSTSAGVFFWILSGKAVMWTVVGGVGTLWGPFVGAGLLIFGEDLLSSWLVKIYPIFMGLVLIIVILMAPKGIVGYLKRRW